MKDYLVKAIEEGDTQKFYQSREWKSKRQEVLKRDNFECQMCKEEGRVGVEDLAVHHVKHLKDRIELGLNIKNLKTLCYIHHNMVHPEKLHKETSNKFINEERW